MSVRLSCPSCNTNFALGAVPADRRATCPRCGDAFPVRGEVAEEESAPAASPAAVPHSAFPAPRSRARSFRRNATTAAGLLVLTLAAGVAIYYTHAPGPEQPPQPPLPGRGPNIPTQLSGLGHLPAECNVLFAVQAGPILNHAHRTSQDPRELLTRAGLPPQALAALDRLGVPLAQVDHVAGGAFIGGEGEELRVALVLVLNKAPPDAENFLRRLGGKPQPKRPTRWEVRPEGVPVALLAESAGPTTWVFGLNDRDLAAVEKAGLGPDGSQFSGGVRAMIAKVPNDAAPWVVADDDRDWSGKPLVKLALQMSAGKKELPAAALKEFRGGLAAVSLGDHPRLRLLVRCADEAASARLQAYFQARAAETPDSTTGGTTDSATFDTPFDPVITGPLLQRMLDDAKK